MAKFKEKIMNECCDWHGICLSENEMYKGKSVYLYYCPECNSISICDNGVLTMLNSVEKELYKEKYRHKINIEKI